MKQSLNLIPMFKEFVQSLFSSVGLELRLTSVRSNSYVQLLAALNHINADLVFDIGANRGQFAKNLRSVGFSDRIISFEPLASAHSILCARARNDCLWYVHPRLALGDRDGEITINVSGNSVSSSVLPMLHAHSSAAEGSSYVASECTPLSRLDSVSTQYLNPSTRAFIKIDVQGYEWEVLDGAAETLKAAYGVMVEMSLVPLYDGQRLWLDLMNRMQEEGFLLWAIQKGFVDPHSGRSLQVDAIFLREI